jgi:type I restriction enzyme S subunit
MSSSVPEGWNLEPIGRYVSSSLAGEWGSEAKSDENDIPILRSTNFTNSGVIKYSNLAVRNVEAKIRVKKALKVGDIVLEKSGGSPTQPVGRVVYFDNEHPFLYSNFTQKLSPTDDCDSKYLFYVLYQTYQDGIVLKFQQQTTGIINFQLAEYLLYKTSFPTLPEQKKIASILTSVDQVIEKTESHIAKLQDLKTGMMQELLTKGIGHTEFKDSPVGRIPVGWDCLLLDAVANRGSGHTPSKSHSEYWNGGIQWVSLADSSRLDKLYISETDKEISQLGIENSSAVMHPKGTVILSRDAGIGKSAILSNNMAVSQHFMAWRCGARLDNYFLYYLLQHWKPRFEAIAMGSTIQTIGLSYFKKLHVPVPPVEEQKKISRSLLSVENTKFSLDKKLVHLKAVKKALMQDLLTGKVRVKTD